MSEEIDKPGTNMSFGPLKPIDAAVLNGGYADVGCGWNATRDAGDLRTRLGAVLSG
jgi:hypothetical protein